MQIIAPVLGAEHPIETERHAGKGAISGAHGGCGPDLGDQRRDLGLRSLSRAQPAVEGRVPDIDILDVALGLDERRQRNDQAREKRRNPGVREGRGSFIRRGQGASGQISHDRSPMQDYGSFVVRAEAGGGALASARITCHHSFTMSTLKCKKVKMAPPKKDTEAITLRLPRDMIDAIDDQRRLEPDLPTRPEMIRRALVQWLEMVEGKSEE